MALLDICINARRRSPALHNHRIKGAHESKQPDIKERHAVSKERGAWKVNGFGPTCVESLSVGTLLL